MGREAFVQLRWSNRLGNDVVVEMIKAARETLVSDRTDLDRTDDIEQIFAPQREDVRNLPLPGGRNDVADGDDLVRPRVEIAGVNETVEHHRHREEHVRPLFVEDCDVFARRTAKINVPAIDAELRENLDG